MASNFMPGSFPTTASSSTTAVSFATASSTALSDAAAYPGSGAPQPRQDTQAYLTQQMLSRRADFIRQQRIRVKVGTWNVAAIQGGIERDLGDWIVDKKEDLRTVSVVAGEVQETVGEDKGGEDKEGEGKESKGKGSEGKGNKGKGKEGNGGEGKEDGDEIGIYVLGLQEVVDITSRDSYFKYLDPKVEMNWKAHAQAALPDGYTCVASTQLMGVLLLVFVSPRLMSLVGSVSTSTVGTGLMGYVGNKGGAGVRLVLGDTLRLVFVDVHLAAFANNTDRRNWDAAEIVRRMTFEAMGRNFIGLDDEDVKKGSDGAPQPAVGEGIENADVLIWCGDLNYRVELPNVDIRRLLSPYMPKDLPPTHDTPSNSPSPIPSSPVIPPATLDESGGPPSEAHSDAGLTLEDTIANILQYDQLRKQQRESKAFVGFKEGNISFVPTYKYDIGTIGVWDSSEKARVPSWCDRVLWKVKGADGERVKGRIRSRTRSSSILTTGEVIFETGDSDEEDLVVSRADTLVPHAPSIKTLPVSSFKSASGEVRLEQLYYSSYQNVTSSDHKPVASLFELSFPAVVPKLRAMVHAEVAREVDKIENERRPVVAIVVDQVEGQPYEEGVVDFGQVRFGQRIQRSITVANTGTSEAKMHFVGKQSDDTAKTPTAWSKDEVIAKEWLKVEFSGDGKDLKDTEGAVVLQPGDACSIIMNLLVEKVEHVRALNEGTEMLADVLVLRVDNGRDVFLPLSAEWLQSGFGRSLGELVKVPEEAGGIRGWAAGKDVGVVRYSAPRELYKMTEFLLKGMRELSQEDGRWYQETGWPFVEETWALEKEKRRMLTVGVWECIDRDLEFDNEAALRIALEPDGGEEWTPTTEEVIEAVAGALMGWLGGLKEGVVPVEMWPDVFKAGGERKQGEQVLDKLSATSSSVHANVFVYLTGFLMDTITILSVTPPLPLQRASTGFSLRRAPTNPPLRRTNTGEEPPMSPIASAAAMAFPVRKLSREVLVRKRVLEVFAEVIVRRGEEGEKKKAEERRVAFLEGFVVGV